MASQPNKPKFESYGDLLASGLQPVASPAPMINGQPARPIPAPPVSSMNRVLVGTLPSEMQLDADFAENQYNGQVPVYRLMPPAASGKAANNAVAQAVTQTIVQQGASGATLETNGIPNSKQTILNLQSGANIELTPDSNGNVRIDAGVTAGFTLLPEGTATASQNFNSNPLTIEASYWNGSAAAIDEWQIQLFPGANPLSSGTDLEINHNTLNGAGRFHINSDMLIGPPLSATSTQNSNSFAWDCEGSYWDGTQTQFAIWEQALGIEPASGDVGLNARLSIYPLFTGAVGTGDIAIGGTGVNPLQGYPVAHSYWILKAFPVSDGHTATLQHTAFTADRTFTFPDATGTLATLQNPQTFSGRQTFGGLVNETLANVSVAAGGTINNLAIPSNSVVFLTGSPVGAITLTGMVAGAAGDIVTICNDTSTGVLITLAQENGGSLAANRFRANSTAQFVLNGNLGSATCYYDGNRWDVISISPNAGQFAASDLTNGTSGTGAVVLATSPTFVTGMTTPVLISASANPATVGVVELAVADVISWRNNANSGNLRLGVDVGDNLELVGGFNGINLKGNNLSQVTNVQSNSANIAHSGFVEMAASDAIAWRNAANSADLLLAKDASDRLTFGGNTVAAPVYNAAGTLQNAVHVVQDTVTLVGGTATITLTGSAAFTSATSYTCTANDQTAANPVKVTQTSGSSITFDGTGTDVIRFIAIGN